MEVIGKMEETNICCECKSKFLVSTSKMMELCPECASILYGYENCNHIFKNGRCIKCLWNGNRSEYIKTFITKSSDISN